ncbi:hypothetical protein PITC_051290 [Penicillium italicum]|uniref:Uncharacterized protein n=1 Tax=Penicillium italicum TaxID=40296 RepID=A0A0A2KUH6_PENIT|nr:hypothetical protein PITC_051290 [Penicillium italicum]
MRNHTTEGISPSSQTATTSISSSFSSFSTSSSASSASSVSSTSSVSSNIYNSSESVALSFTSESMVVNTSEGDAPPLPRIPSIPAHQEPTEAEILDGIAQIAAILNYKDGLNEGLNEERDRLESSIQDAKVLLGFQLCRIEDELTREVLLETFLLHLGPTDAPWMLAPLLARLATGV